MTSCELVTFVSAAACALSKCCNDDELSVMAAVFTQLGDTLATILAHDEFCRGEKTENEELSENEI